MAEIDKDLGVIMALLERFDKYRLPAALKLKEKVDGGGLLDKRDMEFLERVEADAKKIEPLVDRHPEYGELVKRATNLFREITAKALENEQNR
jgi:predicted transcriptional regulator